MSQIEKLKKALAEKASAKQDVFVLTQQKFVELKEQLVAVSGELKKHIKPIDSRVIVDIKSPSKFESQITVAGDTIVFHLHTNVFAFPTDHPLHKSPYVAKVPENGYCGIIHVYNFLTDSFRFNRENDAGYLVARIFINREGNFFVEGRGQLGFLFRDFATMKFDKPAMRQVAEAALLYAIDFDLYTPPYMAVQEVSLAQIKSLSQDLKLKTGKRLGFQFKTDDDQIQ